MNEEIKTLLNVCGMPNEDLLEIYSDTNKSFYMQQFAGLIVRECVEYLKTTDFSEVACDPNAVAEAAATDLLNLFGFKDNTFVKSDKNE